jgi:hypothetical protein
MNILTAILSVLLACAMAMTAVRKAKPDEASIALRDRLGVTPTVWAAVGVPEALAAVGLLAGLVWAPVGLAAAVGVVLIMAGAIALHLRARFLGSALVPPAGVLAFAAVVGALWAQA